MNHYSYRQTRSMLRRSGILVGNKNRSYHCTVCDRNVKSTNHFFWIHPDYIEAAKEAIDNRTFRMHVGRGRK